MLNFSPKSVIILNICPTPPAENDVCDSSQPHLADSSNGSNSTRNTRPVESSKLNRLGIKCRAGLNLLPLPSGCDCVATFLKQKLAEQRNYGIAGRDLSLRDRAFGPT